VRVTPKEQTKIVVHSVPDLEDAALSILDELLARGHVPIVLLEKPLPDDANVARLAAKGVRFFEKSTRRGRWHYLNAGIVFTTHGPFRSHRPAGNQRLVYLGHGEPLAKSAGYWIGNEAMGATVAPVCSTIGKAFRCALHGLRPEQVLVAGASRNDRLVRSDRDAVRRTVDGWLPPGVKTLFLWLPTYRRSVIGFADGVDHEIALPFDLESVGRLDRWLAEHDAAVLLKPHPFSRPYDAAEFERIRTFDEAAMRKAQLSLYPVLGAADCLITDASSVWVDFLLVRRPLICCFPDFDEYRGTRALNLEPYEEWFPGPLVRSLDDLLVEMGRVVEGADTHRERRDWLTDALHVHQDDQASARLLDALKL
jgi:hypothetical protein